MGSGKIKVQKNEVWPEAALLQAARRYGDCFVAVADHMPLAWHPGLLKSGFQKKAIGSRILDNKNSKRLSLSLSSRWHTRIQ